MIEKSHGALPHPVFAILVDSGGIGGYIIIGGGHVINVYPKRECRKMKPNGVGLRTLVRPSK